MSFYYTSFERILRIAAFILTITIPSFYILLAAYNHEILPTVLLTNIARDSLDVPLPAGLEAILMLIVFEILKEAGIRIPSSIGQTLSIVGAVSYTHLDVYKRQAMSKGEFNSVKQAVGGLDSMINGECKDQDTVALIKYITEEAKEAKVLENQQVLRLSLIHI